MPRKIDIIGTRFGRLVVCEGAGKDIEGLRWLCLCDCGTAKVVSGKHLRRGAIRSCGCLRKETSRAVGLKVQHGQSLTPEYRAWRNAKDRCHNPRNRQFANYGARGIVVAAEWRDSFEAFYAHVGARPSSSHSIDRINNDLGYEPGNVRWVIQKVQARNRRTNRLVNFEGRTVTLAEAIEARGLRTGTVRMRIASGWSIEAALS